MRVEQGRGKQGEEGGEELSLLLMMRMPIISLNVRGLGRRRRGDL